MTKPADVIDTQRLDKWLWHARIVKSRSLATQLVLKGKFRVNREKIAKASFLVKAGDVITAALGSRVRIVQVAGFSARRGPPVEARALYLDLTPPPQSQSTAPDSGINSGGNVADKVEPDEDSHKPE